MTRQQRIINRLLEAAQLAMRDEHVEVILSISSDPDDVVSTSVESTPTTFLTVGTSMAVKAAIDNHIPLFLLQELIAKLYEDILGEEVRESDPDMQE